MELKGLAFVFFIINLFLFAFYPTSALELSNVDGTILNYSILLFIVVWLIISYAKLDKSIWIISLVVICYMIIITIMSMFYNPYARPSIARLAPVILCLILLCCRINLNVSFSRASLLLDIFMFFCILWNILIISGNEFIYKFTVDYYSQLYQDATSNMFLKKRPIMSFSIYTFASYFYFLFFLLSYVTYKELKSKKHIIYCFILFVFNILLASNTTLVFSVLMAIMLLKLFDKLHVRLVLIVLISITIVYILSFTDIYSYYIESLTSDANGFRGRYLSTGTLSRNLEYVSSSFFIGFTIIDNLSLTYTDSGYMLYYSMGGLFFTICMYYLFYKFLKNNVKYQYKMLFFITMMFEVALPVLIYSKFIYAMIFYVIYLNSLYAKKNNLLESTTYERANFISRRDVSR